MWPNQQETANLVIFTEKILDEKLFLQRLLKIILTLRDSRSLHKIRENTGECGLMETGILACLVPII